MKSTFQAVFVFVLLEKKLEQESRLARVQYEQKQYEASQKLPDTIKEVDKLRDKVPQLDSQYMADKSVRDGLSDIMREWDIFMASDQNDVDINNKLNEMTKRASEITAAAGENYDFSGAGMAGIGATLAEYEKSVNKTVEEFNTAQTELDAAVTNAKEYYDSSKHLVEMDLGGNFEEQAAYLTRIKDEIQALEAAGNTETEHFAWLQGLDAEMTPKLEEAAIKMQELNDQVAAIPEVKTIDVGQAVSGLDTVLQKLQSMPRSISIRVATQSYDTPIGPGLATGGIITSPIVTPFAEDGPEAAIPLDGSSRAKSLWVRAGQMLGMYDKPTNAERFLEMESGGGGGEGSTVAAPVTMNFSPVVNIQGNGDESAINSALDALRGEFEGMLEQALHNKQRKSFA